MKEKREMRKIREERGEKRFSFLSFLFSYFFSLFSLFSFLFSSPSFAGGPWMIDVDNTGTPAHWPRSASRGKWVVRWKVDPGPLSVGRRNINSEQAVQDYIQPMLNDWQNVSLPYQSGADPVKTVAIEFIQEGAVSEDITVSNYCRYAIDGPGCRDPARPPSTVVIFDVDGSIIEDYCLRGGGSVEDCAAAKNGIAGQALPFPDSTGKIIRQGFIFLNGRLINGDPADGEADPEGFKAVIKHEFGHLLNLDHAQINTELAVNCGDGSCEGGMGVGTMFPELVTNEQYSLHRDDKVTISWLYPSQDFLDKFCWIAGRVENEEGKGIQGVNVIARSVNDPVIDARAMVSGVLYAEGTENGDYILAGIMPGEEYEVVYEELLAEYNAKEASGFMPLGDQSPTGFGTGTILGPENKATVHCGAGGEQIDMQPLRLSIEQGRALSGAVNVEGEGGEPGTGEKKGWCALVPNQTFTWDGGVLWGLGIIVLFLLGRERRKERRE